MITPALSPRRCLTALLLIGSMLLAPAATVRCRLMVTGDSRGPSPSEEVNTEILRELAAEAVRLQPDMFLFTGDFTYSGAYSGLLDWQAALADIYDAGIPVYPIRGNHELGDPSAYDALFRWDLPQNGPENEEGLTYFVATKNVLVLGIDQFSTPQMVNMPWVDSVLATNTRPHIIAMGHEPAFKVLHYDCMDAAPDSRNAFWSALASHGCRAYFAGHDHFYDHMRVDDGDGNPDNDVHQLIVGTAGAPNYSDGPYDGNNDPYQPTFLFHEANFGYVLVDTDGLDATLTWMSRTGVGTYEAAESWSYSLKPKITLKLEPAGPAQLRLSYPTLEGETYIIEESFDLTSWHGIATNVAISAQAQLDIDCAAACRLFRVRCQNGSK